MALNWKNIVSGAFKVVKCLMIIESLGEGQPVVPIICWNIFKGSPIELESDPYHQEHYSIQIKY